MKLIALAMSVALLSIIPGPARAVDKAGDELLARLDFLRRQSEKQVLTPQQEKVATQAAWEVWRVQVDHPWTWWFYIGDVGKGTPAPGSQAYLVPPATGSNTLHLKTWALDASNSFLAMLPQELVDAGLAAVQYEAAFGLDAAWQVIGTSSDSGSFYSLDYSFTGFEPIIRATLLDASGQRISLFDSDGTEYTQAVELAIGVIPEPGSWALMGGGLALLGVALCRRAAAAHRASSP